MPQLGALFVTLVGALAGFLVRFVTWKAAVALVISGLLGVLIGGIFLSMRGALQLAVAGAGSVHPMFGAGVSVVISPRVASLIASFLSFWVLTELYKWKVNLLQLWARTI